MKPFEIQLQGKPYTIKLKSFGRVDINGTTQYIRSLPHRNVLFIPMEYDLPIPEGKVMLASGRPTPGMRRYEEELELARYGGYLLSFNGARIVECRTGEVIYQRNLPYK